MKIQGTVTEFDGYNGYVQDEFGKRYILMKEEVMDGAKICVGDRVSFVPEERHGWWKAFFIRKVGA